MAICYHGNGCILLKKETAKEFSDKFNEQMKKYIGRSDSMCNDEGLLQFKNYARHYFIDDCRKLIEENIEQVDEGRLWFNCHDEDGSPERPFPQTILLEITGGKVYEETLHTRLNVDWDMRNADYEWFEQH